MIKNKIRKIIAIGLSTSILISPLSGLEALAYGNDTLVTASNEKKADDGILCEEISSKEAGKFNLDTTISETAEEKNIKELDKDEQVRVFITIDGDSAIDKGYSTEDIADNKKAISYMDKLEDKQDDVVTDIEKEVLDGDKLDVNYNFTLITNAVSAEVSYGDIEAIKDVDGVSDVCIAPKYDMQEENTDSDGEKNNTEEASSLDKEVSASDENNSAEKVSVSDERGISADEYTGADMRIAVIDSGIELEHQSFNEEAFKYSIKNKQTDLLDKDKISSILDKLNAYKRHGSDIKTEDVYYNEKVAFGYNYIDENFDISHVNDNQGDHGTNVAGVAAANAYIKSGNKFVLANGDDYTVGAAPDAQLVIMKVFGSEKMGGAWSDDYCAAIEDAILLGCDVINLSIGSPYPGFTASYGEAYVSGGDAYVNSVFEKIENTDTVITMSAGNSGYWSKYSDIGYTCTEDVSTATGGFPGTLKNAFTVGSVDNFDIKSEIEETDDIKITDEKTWASSWGVPGNLTIKPEILTPGNNIYCPAENNTYELKAGTSFAAPNVAGFSALVKEYYEKSLSKKGIKDMTARNIIQSLLMSTAVPLKDKEGVEYPVRQQGSGLCDIKKAIATPAVITVEGQDDGKVKAELKDDIEKTGRYSFNIKIVNTSKSPLTYKLESSVLIPKVKTENGLKVMDITDTKLDAKVSYDVIKSGKSYIDGDKLKLSEEDTAVISVNITLNLDGKAFIEKNYKNGCYIEGYTYLNAVNDEKSSIKAVNMSIPFLGFYGNFTDPSMYERSIYLDDYNDNIETKNYITHEDKTNYYVINKSGKDYAYIPNAYGKDDEYIADRNAISLEKGNKITKFCYSLIRNAKTVSMNIKNSDTVYYHDEDSYKYSEYYSISSKHWNYEDNVFEIQWDGKTDGSYLKEGTNFKYVFEALPEYYNEVGKGTKLELPMAVDNTKPEFISAKVNDDKTVSITLKDNRYTAAVLLYDADGVNKLSTTLVNQAQEKKGKEITVKVPLPENLEDNDGVFLMVLADYAENESYYRINLKNTEDTMDKYAEKIALEDSSMEFPKGASQKIKATVFPRDVKDTGVTFKSSNPSVAAVDEEGIVTAISDGTAIITVTANTLDKNGNKVTTECKVKVEDKFFDLYAYRIDANDFNGTLISFNTADISKYNVLSDIRDDYCALTSKDGTIYADTWRSSDSELVKILIPEKNQEKAKEEVFSNMIINGEKYNGFDMTILPDLGEKGSIVISSKKTLYIYDCADGKLKTQTSLDIEEEITGVAYAYTKTEGGIKADYYYYITENGNIYSTYAYKNAGEYYIGENSGCESVKIGSIDFKSGKGAYNSLICKTKDGKVYLLYSGNSEYTGENSLFTITLDKEGKVFNTALNGVFKSGYVYGLCDAEISRVSETENKTEETSEDSETEVKEEETSKVSETEASETESKGAETENKVSETESKVSETENKTEETSKTLKNEIELVDKKPQIEENKTSDVDTGDYFSIGYLILFIMSAIGIVVMIIKKNKK